ncbi:MAG: hypothetical protein EOO10_20005 [Chitinophagaceae bacterium]|nr:MAG: hypothetical protein EOO10_20005 [Chitinophagaceae bacterium]
MSVIHPESILQWGEQNGVLHYIDEVANGIECNCVCSYCKNRLVAKNGGSRRAHHFAHFAGVECAKAIESAVHKLAKQVLAQTLKLRLPSCSGFGPYGIQEYIPEAVIAFEKVATEINFVIAENIIRPDAIGYLNGKDIFIEFRFTHSVSDAKQALIKQANKSCVEIVLNTDLQEPGQMEAFLQDNAEDREWIFHRALQRLIAAHNEREKPKIEEERRKQSERDRRRHLRRVAEEKAAAEKWAKQERLQRENEKRRFEQRERELAEARKKGNLYHHCPVSADFLLKFYQTKWGKNNVIDALRGGVWFQRKIFDYWPEKEIDIFVDNIRYILVPRKEEYDKLAPEQKLYHDYLLQSVRKYGLLYHREINYCSFCKMFAGKAQEFIVCRYKKGDDTSMCLDYDKL